jgi:hypothetical protein
MQTILKEITREVRLCGVDGRLNPDAAGWSRKPFHICNSAAGFFVRRMGLLVHHGEIASFFRRGLLPISITSRSGPFTYSNTIRNATLTDGDQGSIAISMMRRDGRRHNPVRASRHATRI